MVGQHGIDLAIDLITTHFGDLVAKVCSCLLKHGPISLQEISRFTQLSSSRVKNCLLVLIQHNCIQAFSSPKGSSEKLVTLYAALFDGILHRMRFPKFLGIVNDDLGEQCETLLEGLLQNGRLTFEQLLERTISKLPEASESTRKELRVNFNKLVHSHYVERCPKPEPFLVPTSEDQSTRKRGAKTNEQSSPLEQQAATAAALSHAERFSEIPDIETETVNFDVADHHHVFSAGDKRKYEALEIDQELESTITENEVLWRANYEKFVYCLKKKACASNVRARLGLDAGLILEAMVEANGQEKVGTKNSVTSSMNIILERVREKPGGIAMTLEHIRVVLDQLNSHSSTDDAGALYTIDLNNIIEACQNDEVEALVQARYGQEAYRIFRLLVKSGHPIETDRIAEVTFVEKKDAQLILYKLWKDEYLDMEKVTLHVSGPAQLSFWKLNKKALWEHILDDMYHAALNLSQKISHIVEQQHEVSRDTERHLLRRKIILQQSLLKLDDALMLFHDF
ncbi:uncharacterized protein [Typha angustifolia]|uniref:uncharacterized protein isoform X1 n=1 Tax=Typha angustifolia TaxID=59011 RepID=UPI003C306675